MVYIPPEKPNNGYQKNVENLELLKPIYGHNMIFVDDFNIPMFLTNSVDAYGELIRNLMQCLILNSRTTY